MSRPMVVVETGKAGLDDARGELLSRGWTEVAEVVVSDEPSAAAAVIAAVDGRALLVDARASRQVLDRLCDDLRRLGHLDHRVESIASALSADQHALLRLLAGGATLGSAARTLHLSRRSADRRLAAAREALRTDSTGAAVAAYQRRLERLPAPPT